MTTYHTFVGPRCYLQGAGALTDAGTLIRPLGAKAFVLYERSAVDLWNRRLAPALGAAGIASHGAQCSGACSGEEIERAIVAARVVRADIVIGLGGGGTLAAAKVVASALGAALVIIPTVACVNASTSVSLNRRPPDLILVDTQVIADALAQTFIAAIGDALPVWFEARAAAQSYATTAAGGWQTIAAGSLAKACWETLRLWAPEAIAAVRAHRVTEAVEKVVEAITLLGGLGAESGGLAAAHAIRNGLAALPELRGLCSGALMPFALLAQLELEKHTEQDRRDVLAFCRTVGLPVCFADLGVPDVTPVQIACVAERALVEGETIYHEPCALSPETVMEALRSADARGQAGKVNTVAA